MTEKVTVWFAAPDATVHTDEFVGTVHTTQMWPDGRALVRVDDTRVQYQTAFRIHRIPKEVSQE